MQKNGSILEYGKLNSAHIFGLYNTSVIKCDPMGAEEINVKAERMLRDFNHSNDGEQFQLKNIGITLGGGLIAVHTTSNRLFVTELKSEADLTILNKFEED